MEILPLLDLLLLVVELLVVVFLDITMDQMVVLVAVQLEELEHILVVVQP